ncbi:MAG: hypothetical protein J6J11_04015, partial [Treponema sp.]|nr:hypothetical protein [Treponema sp.]
AEICNLNEFEFMKYSRSLKDYRDWHNTLNHAIEEKTAKISKKLLAKGRKEGIAVGREEGREEGITIGMETGTKNTQKEIARKMLDKGMDINSISELSGLSIEEINDI